jgi:hypothetical protein
LKTYYLKNGRSKPLVKPLSYQAENGMYITRRLRKKKLALLSGAEFLRRFACHIFPPGFMRIRHYGFLASRNKKTELNLAKKALKQPQWSPEKTPVAANSQGKAQLQP